MRKPTFVYPFVFSILLAGCTKAEFEKIVTDAGARDGSVDSRADATAQEVQCEDKATTVCVKPYPDTTVSMACPDVCHTTVDQPAETGEVCVPGAASDNCDTENVCLATVNGGKIHICFKLCTDATQCSNNVACAARFMSDTTWVKVCDLQYDSCEGPTGCCDPINPYSGKCGGNTCYLVAPLNTESKDSRTVCEYVDGDGLNDQPCGTSRDCIPKYACFFPLTSPERGNCKLVCDPKDQSACKGSGCQAYNNQYGVCM